jgi:hypothetical protein
MQVRAVMCIVFPATLAIICVKTVGSLKHDGTLPSRQKSYQAYLITNDEQQASTNDDICAATTATSYEGWKS